MVNNVTYASLVTLINNSQLVIDDEYNITDYETTVHDTYSVASHTFRLTVKAYSENSLYVDAKAYVDDETYFTNDMVSNWHIKYDINNDTDKYNWADSENGKGVIYYLCDELNNEAYFDFKNIKNEDGYFLFHSEEDDDDATMSNYETVKNNSILYPIDYNDQYYLNSISLFTAGYNSIIGNQIDARSSSIRILSGGAYVNENYACYNIINGESYDVELNGHNNTINDCSTIVINGENNSLSSCEDFNINDYSYWIESTLSTNVTINSESKYVTINNCTDGITLDYCENVDLFNSSNITLDSCTEITINDSTIIDLNNSENDSISNSTNISTNNLTGSSFSNVDTISTTTAVTSLNEIFINQANNITFDTNISNGVTIESGVNNISLGTDYSTKYGDSNNVIISTDNTIITVNDGTNTNTISSDGTLGVNTNAYINDAPGNNKTYGRKNGEWSEITGGGSYTGTSNQYVAGDGTYKESFAPNLFGSEMGVNPDALYNSTGIIYADGKAIIGTIKTDAPTPLFTYQSQSVTPINQGTGTEYYYLSDLPVNGHMYDVKFTSSHQVTVSNTIYVDCDNIKDMLDATSTSMTNYGGVDTTYNLYDVKYLIDTVNPLVGFSFNSNLYYNATMTGTETIPTGRIIGTVQTHNVPTTLSAGKHLFIGKFIDETSTGANDAVLIFTYQGDIAGGNYTAGNNIDISNSTITAKGYTYDSLTGSITTDTIHNNANINIGGSIYFGNPTSGQVNIGLGRGSVGTTSDDGLIIYMLPETATFNGFIELSPKTGKSHVIGSDGSLYPGTGNTTSSIGISTLPYINGYFTNISLNGNDLSTTLSSKANDSSVVHLSGAETITGVKTHQAAIKMQGGDNLLDSTSHYLGLGAYGNKTLTISDATSTGGAGAVYPASDGTINLGTDSQRFQTVKAHNIMLNRTGSLSNCFVTNNNEMNLTAGMTSSTLYANYRGATNAINTISWWNGTNTNTRCGHIASVWNTDSDERLKQNIKTLDIDNAIAFVKNVEPKTFEFKSEPDKECIGLIAQDVEKYYPEIVLESPRGKDDDTLYKSIDYSKLVAPLLAVVKKQQEQIEELQKIINKL